MSFITKLKNFYHLTRYGINILSSSLRNSTSYENPVSKGKTSVFHNYIKDNYRFIQFEFQINKYISYNSFLPEYVDFYYSVDKFSRVNLKADIIRSIVPTVNDDMIVNFKFTSSPYMYVYKRYYVNIIDQIAALGGSFYVIYAIALFLIYIFIRFDYYESLSNSFYKIITFQQ